VYFLTTTDVLIVFFLRGFQKQVFVGVGGSRLDPDEKLTWLKQRRTPFNNTIKNKPSIQKTYWLHEHEPTSPDRKEVLPIEIHLRIS
jgi:hypothetical protein